MRILSFDPGVTTGFCCIVNGNLTEYAELQDMKAVTDYICHYGENTPVDHIVYEGFARGNSVVKEQLITIEMCGAIKAASLILQVPYHMQYPAERKGYIPIAKAMLKDTFGGSYKDWHHSTDAVAHALTFMDKEKLEWQKQHWMHRAFQ